MKVIGLDIGSHSVKALEMEIWLRQVELIDFYEEKLPYSSGDPKSDDIKSAIKNIFLQHVIVPPFKLAAAIPGLWVSSRTIIFPFTDKSKIRQTLPFELEEHIPFDLENIVYEYQISASDKTSTLLILLTEKEIIQSRLSLFEHPDVSPDLLTSDAASLYNLMAYSGQETSEVYALINIGKSQTGMAIVDEGRLSQVRSISLGGQAITDAIQTQYKLSSEEGEKAKIENGFVLTEEEGATQDQVKFSNCIKEALDPLISQINQTFQANRSKGKGIVRKAYVTGGTSLLRNLPQYLSLALHVEVEFLKVLKTFELNNIADQDANHAKATQALALALGCVGSLPSQQFNFRKQEFSRYQKGPLSHEVKYLAGIGSIILLILFLNIAGNFFILKSTLKSLDSQMIEITKKFPIKIPPHLLEDATQLRAFLNKTAKEHQEKIEALGGSKGGELTTLQILEEISQLAPKQVLFDVRELSIVDGKIKLKAISDSFNTIDNIEKMLKANPKFTKVIKGEISTASDGRNKDFTLSFEIKRGKS